MWGRQERAGHELSSPMDGMGHCRGWQPGSKPWTACRIAKHRRAGMREERRLVWRVLGQWMEISDTGRVPRRAEIGPWLKGEDGANCLLIAVGWSVELTQPVVVGINLAAILC